MANPARQAFLLVTLGLAGGGACTVGEYAAGDHAAGEITVTRSSEVALRGHFDSATGVRLDFEVVESARGPTARVTDEEEGVILRVERGERGEPVVSVGAVPLAEASEDASPAELLRVSETEPWSAVPALVEAAEELDPAPALVATLRLGLEIASDAIREAADAHAEYTRSYSGNLFIYGCMSWYQARSVANGRCQSYGYSYANSVTAYGWTRCGTDSYGNALYRTFEYQCYRGSSW